MTLLTRCQISDVLKAPLRLSVSQRIWAGAALLLIVTLTWLAWPRPLSVETAVIDRGTVRTEVVDEARTRMHDVFIVSAPVTGELQRIELEPGDAVERGQVVAVIAPADPALLDARVAAEADAGIASARAALAAAEADLELARGAQRRTATLFERGFASEAARDNADAAWRAARASLNARRADLTRARAAAGAPTARARRATPVPSPASGRILRVLQQSETIAIAGAPLLEIGDPSQIEIAADFISQDVVGMQGGASAAIENWGGETPIPARVFRIEPYARTTISALGVEEQRVTVILHLLDPDSAPPLGHGFRVDARVVVNQEDAVVRVPTDALVRDGEVWAVFVIRSGRARLTRIEIGDGGGEYRAVRNGLSPGDRVVLFPGDAFADGASVTPRRSN